ncbi:hypothetical protein V2J09_016067 [Rumex salicifolius]
MQFLGVGSDGEDTSSSPPPLLLGAIQPWTTTNSATNILCSLPNLRSTAASITPVSGDDRRRQSNVNFCGSSLNAGYAVALYMNHMHPNGRAESYETPVPGCLGKMANLFDLTSGIARNKLLTDKPHYDVSLLSRSRSDISRMTSPSGEEIKDKMINSDGRSSSVKKSERTPVKKLIAQEMSKSLDSRHSSPNVVARLMGLDALPRDQHLQDFGRGKRCHSRNSYSEIPAGYWRQEDDFIHGEINCENHPHKCKHKYKDIYEIWQPSSQASSLRSESPRNGTCSDYTNGEKMDFVRQKFMEAKRLSTNENLRQTKEFQDALEQQIPPPSGMKRITVLKPSKMVSGGEKPSRKSPTREQNSGGYRFSPSVATSKAEECLSQPTRIVVLKPSPGRIQDGKTLAFSTAPVNLRQEELVEKPGDDEAQEAMEFAKEITQKLRENLAGHRRDETLLSSVFSNGYTGDESSFNKSEAEILVDNLSDTEVMSPVSRHSWDHASQFGSPYSCSSSSHAYYSPEPSVCQEAKKRLSERWAMVASNVSGGKQRYAHRSSSTLGEMLALSDVTKSEIFEVEDIKRGQESRASTSCLNSNTREREIESSQSLVRSKSLPAASGQSLPTRQSSLGAMSVSNPAAVVKQGDNKDQLSSISFLEPMYKDDGKIVNGSIGSSVPSELGKHISLGKSNLIDKSPPIGSIPRMLSQEEPYTFTAPAKGGAAEEEEEWLFLVRSLLSAASLEHASKLSWHSPQSPLDPLLRDKYIDPNTTEPSHNAKWRHLRSIHHLVFDCVNAALIVDTMVGPTGTALECRVWAQMKEWLNAGSCEGEEAMWDLLEEEGGDVSCLVADRAARKEVIGKGWDDEMKVEVENMVKEIEWKLMEDMIEECVCLEVTLKDPIGDFSNNMHNVVAQVHNRMMKDIDMIVVPVLKQNQ